MEGRTKKTKSRRGRALLVILCSALLLLALLWLLANMPFSRPALAAAETPNAEPSAVPSLTPSPTPEPTVTGRPGYFLCPDGLFRPEEPLRRGEAAAALSLALGQEVAPAGEETETLTPAALGELLSQLFPARRVSAALDRLPHPNSDSVSRAEAAVCFNFLLNLLAGETGAYGFPDVAPDYWAREEILTAASTSAWEEAPPAPGLFFLDGALYFVGEDGYFLKNRYEGSRLFGSDGKFTSGSRELDGYVESILSALSEENTTREELLRAAYLYVRDSFAYLTRHYYRIGDVGWQVEEAITMFSTGRGNCYCYAASFWALARGLGYEAKIISGTVTDGAPHGWVEIYTPDGRLTYDVELEMATHRDGRRNSDFYAMTDPKRSGQKYIEQAFSDNLVPRESNDGLLPG